MRKRFKVGETWKRVPPLDVTLRLLRVFQEVPVFPRLLPRLGVPEWERPNLIDPSSPSLSP